MEALGGLHAPNSSNLIDLIDLIAVIYGTHLI